jgi:hypothetical protein
MIGILLTEVDLNYNWNVYKVFKSGKRAKAPYCQVAGKNEETAREILVKELNSKMQKNEWIVVRSDMSQEREYEKNLEKEKEISKKKNYFLGKLAFRGGGVPNNIVTGLLFTRETNWKWQWAACEPGTMKFIKAISPSFKSAIKAEDWLINQMEKQI